MKDLLKTTGTVLRKHGLPDTMLEKLHDQMREAKSSLDSTLGLTEATLFRKSIPLARNEADVRKDYPQTYSVIAHVLHQAIQAGSPIDLGSVSLIENTVKVKNQESKLSRVLAKQLKGQEEVLKYCMPELGINKPEQFLPKLGDIVKSGRQLWVSTNILDFLYASEHASFTSCHSLSGCHFNGNLAYARDGLTLITFVSDEKPTSAQHEIYKLGRSWMFVVNNTIIQPKSYGAYYDFERDMARLFVEEKIAESLGVENKWKIKRGESINEVYFESPQDKYSGSGALYLDNYDLDISYLGSYNSPSVEFSAAMCLECGQTTDYPSKGVCSEHDGKIKATCPICGERHLTHNMYTVGGEFGTVCCTCFNLEFASCGHCGNYHRKGVIETIDGRFVCATCKQTHYTTCECCGTFTKKDKMNNLKGVGTACISCQEKYMLCSICGDYHHKEDVEYYKYVGRVCKVCVEFSTFTCTSCGEVHPITDRKVTGMEYLCPACEARREGKEVTLKFKPKYADLPEGWDDYVEEVG